MASHTKQSLEYFKWVLNRMQTSRAVDAVTGNYCITYVYGDKKNDPSEPEQDKILKALKNKKIIKIVRTSYRNLISVKTGKKIPIIEDGPEDLSHFNIFPYSRELIVSTEKFNTLVLNYEILANQDYIKYEFDPNKIEGNLKIGKIKPIPFEGSRSLILQFFYEHKNELNQKNDFEMFQKYVAGHTYDNIKNSKILDNKKFREAVVGINKRVKKETKSIEAIISVFDSIKKSKRNNYKWEILFKTI